MMASDVNWSANSLLTTFQVGVPIPCSLGQNLTNASMRSSSLFRTIPISAISHVISDGSLDANAASVYLRENFRMHSLHL